jgi:hypothetical protein
MLADFGARFTKLSRAKRMLLRGSMVAIPGQRVGTSHSNPIFNLVFNVEEH